MSEILSRGFVLLLLCTIASNTDSVYGVCKHTIKTCMRCLEEMIDVKDSIDGNKE